MRRFPSHLATDLVPLHALERLWSLRILVPMGALKRLVQDTIGNHEVFISLGVGDAELDELSDPERYKLLHLRPQQAAELLRRHCRTLQVDAPQDADIVRVSQLATLTPGDFAAVVRRHAFHPFAAAGDMLDALAVECSLKSGGRQAIGFVTQ